MNKRAVKHRIEYSAVWIFAMICGALPVDVASNVGGFIARMIGPKTGIDRIARAQMRAVFPNFTDDEINTYMSDMWDNLGRVMAEYPHLDQIGRERIILCDDHNVLKGPDFLQKPAIFMGGHFANWEICGPGLYARTGVPLNLVYRPANNAMIDRLMTHFRSMGGRLPTLAKSRGGMRAMIDRLGGGHKLGLLIDQKYTEGIMADFFGIQASATTIYAQLGARFNASIYPTQVIRVGRTAHFRVVIHPALKTLSLDGMLRPAADIVGDAHALMFDWVRAYPGQWLWVHQRWGRDVIPRG